VANLTPPQPVSAPAPAFVVVIDPAHGGDDHGGAITGKLAEKDATLAIARNLYRQLDSRGIAVRLLRDGDNTITPDQRAVMANAGAPSLYIALHASAAGNGVRVFISRLQQAPRAPGFLPWNTAQAAYAGASQETATAMVTELLKHDVSGLSLTTSLRPLSNVASPAVAVEVAPPLHGNDLMSFEYEQTVCSSIATAVANSRARLPQGGATR
jgi:N-acetylmuramoyl-L-alanine amidase